MEMTQGLGRCAEFCRGSACGRNEKFAPASQSSRRSRPECARSRRFPQRASRPPPNAPSAGSPLDALLPMLYSGADLGSLNELTIFAHHLVTHYAARAQDRVLSLYYCYYNHYYY